ncbi:MAG: T9SS type A sorting domain-containing protein, partial [Ignavibacteriota bacterium]
SAFILEQNYPNPFNPSTTISFTIPNVTLSLSSRAETRDEGFQVQLQVYDILGNDISTLVNEEKPAGNYSINFDGQGLASGIYFYKLKVGIQESIKKMILLR